MSERESEARAWLRVVAKFCVSLSLICLIVLFYLQREQIRDLQRRIAVLEQSR